MTSTGISDFVLPTSIKFGDGRAIEVGKEATALMSSKAMIVTDQGIIKAGLIDKIQQALLAEKIKVTVFGEVEPNPRDTTVARGAEIAKNEDVDVLIAIGGDNAIDVAKAIGIVLSHGGSINDFEGIDTVDKLIIPLIAIPTTVGTGSEVTFLAVITDTKKKFKISIRSPLIAPKVTLVDPEMVYALPPRVIAFTGIDALAHAVEGYTCLLSSPITDACGIYAIQLIAANIRTAVYTDNKESKRNMLLASLIAGIAFGNTDMAGVHSMTEAVGGLYDTPRGMANAILLPYVMAYNFVADTYKHAKIAVAMGENISGLSERDAAYKAVEAVKKLNKDINIPLKDIGVLREDLRELAARSAAHVSSGSNVRKVTEADYLELFKIAFIDE